MAGKLFRQRKYYAVYGDARPFLLERACNEIIELDNGKIYQYKGNYSYYLEKKEERIASEKLECGQSPKPIHQRIGMDASPTKSENDQIEIASG